MPNRTHWVYSELPGLFTFDQRAYEYLKKRCLNRMSDSMTSLRYEEAYRQFLVLPAGFRKGIPALLALMTRLRLTHPKNLKNFKLSKRLRRKKNPILGVRR